MFSSLIYKDKNENDRSRIWVGLGYTDWLSGMI
ncbi:unnamed protein product [Camellia sinensis]